MKVPRAVACALPLVVVLLAPAAAAVPTTLTYAGVLEEDGAPLNGTVDVTFKLFTLQSAGVEVYTEDINGLIVLEGDLVAELGSAGLDDSILDRAELWLEVQVDGDVLTPRVRLNSVPYALRAELALVAEDALTFGGLLSTDVVTQAQLASLAGAGLAFSGGAFTIATGGVTSTRLATGAVTTAAIGDAQVTLAKLAPNSVDSSKIVAGSIAGSDIGTGVVGALQIATDGVGSAELNGTEVVLFSTVGACGTPTFVTLGPVCVTEQCGAAIFRDCAGACNQLAVQVCQNTAVGKLLSPTN